jgi:hypothetical protein
MPRFTLDDADYEYENPDYIKMIISNDTYQSVIEELFGDEDQRGDSGFWTHGAESRVYLECKYNILEHFKPHFSKDFKKDVIHTYGIFKALRDYKNKYGSIDDIIKELEDGDDETEFYDSVFGGMLWEHIREYEEMYREDDRVGDEVYTNKAD